MGDTASPPPRCTFTLLPTKLVDDRTARRPPYLAVCHTDHPHMCRGRRFEPHLNRLSRIPFPQPLALGRLHPPLPIPIPQFFFPLPAFSFPIALLAAGFRDEPLGKRGLQRIRATGTSTHRPDHAGETTTSSRLPCGLEHEAAHGLDTTTWMLSTIFPASSQVASMTVCRLNEVGHQVASVG